jgi:hypothetical protein
MPNLEMVSYREYIQRAVAGNRKAELVIENTYSIHFASVYLLYTWTAFGLMGQDKDEAISHVSDVLVGSTNSLQDVYTMMNMTVQMGFEQPFDLEAFAALLKPPVE